MELLAILAYLLVAMAFVDVHQAKGNKKIRTYMLSFIWPYCVGRWIADKVEKEVTHETDQD